MKPKMILLAGPPGSGKSTMAKQFESQGFVRISQDDQGKGGHQDLFLEATRAKKDVVVDRMNFNKQQRLNYLAYGTDYETEIIVIHENYETCLKRAIARTDHPTIKDEKNARAALQTFFTKYERPEAHEANKLTFLYPPGLKPKVIVCDLDGTLCDVEHRRHHVRPPEGVKKNWPAFFDGIPNDTVILPVAEIINQLMPKYPVIFCSGRDDNQRRMTTEWLTDKLGLYEHDDYKLYMRNRHDSRQDSIVKENILDFELLTRYNPYFMLDDRDQVVQMWRRRGFICLQVADGNF